jgi:ribosomal protein S18 acetylase RimI-like enzyme
MVAMGALRRTGLDLAEVKRMRVEPAYQGRGYGQNILTTLEKRAADLGYRNLHLDTAVHLEAARHLYERNGYREMRRGKIGSLDCVFYEKNLV